MKFFGEFVPGTDSWISLSVMKTEQTITLDDRIVKAPMPNEQRYNVSLFFQDYFPGNDRIKMNLKGVLAGGMPLTVPAKGYKGGTFSLPSYKRVDIGMSYQLANFSRNLKNIWIGMDIFNLFDIRNTNSYYWITDAYGSPYAVPNYLTGRQFNLRLIFDF
jgi:hypothetical protein